MWDFIKDIWKGIRWFAVRKSAQVEVAKFIDASIERIDAEVTALQLIVTTLEQRRTEDTSHTSSLRSVIRQFGELPTDKLTPVFKVKNEYNNVQTLIGGLVPIADNYEQSFQTFETVFQNTLSEKTEVINDILSNTERLNNRRRRNGLSGADLDLAVEVDEIVGNWQQSSPTIAEKVMSGDSIDLFVIEKEVIEPLADACRRRNTSMEAVELLKTIRRFWTTFNQYTNARELHRTELNTSIKRLQDIRIQLEHIREHL